MNVKLISQNLYIHC